MGGFLCECGKTFGEQTCIEMPGCFAISVHLLDEFVDTTELLFQPQAVDEGDFELAPVEIAGPVQDMNL